MSFILPDLAYDYDALEPVIDAKTMKIHHDLHHGGYVDKLNAALEGQDELLELNIEELMKHLDGVPMEIETAVKNNGGGHANHSLFWTVMSKDGGGEPGGELEKAILLEYDSFEIFKKTFTETAVSQFGSGWAWLVVEDPSTGSGHGGLHVCSTANQDNPWMRGNTPILGLDVWEHAYYLKYQNRRAEYVEKWWEVVNWKEVERRYKEAIK